ncbi:MAG: hypothetical protein JXR53_06040, partial [Bacteroidales bacterium]|nr:hypothetical protein [Bacteroidales bacterium]
MENLLLLGFIFIFFDFIRVLITGKRILGFYGCLLFDFNVIVWLVYIFFDSESGINSCCIPATFAPDHRFTILAIVILSVIAYFISAWRRLNYSPVIGVLVNIFLLIGIVFNVFMSIQLQDFIFFFGNVPIGLLFIMELMRNHKHYIELNKKENHEYKSVIERLAWKILTAKIFWKIPILLILILPVMTIIISFLLLFGQK